MKKTLLVATLALGFTTFAQAESSVTLYGVVDAGIGYQGSIFEMKDDPYGRNNSLRTSTVGAQQGISSDNLWGMMGSEDLGNGTSAVFKLEGAFNIANGTSNDGKLFSRESYLGLSGDWGTFTIGRQYSASDAFVAPIDPFGTDFAQASSISTFGDSVSTLYDSALKYVSPEMGGFQMGVGVVVDYNKTEISGLDDQKKRSTGVTAGFGWTLGDLYVGGSFDYLRNKKSGYLTDSEGRLPGVQGYTSPDNYSTTTKAWNLGLTYDFNVVKLHALYGQQLDGVIGGGTDLVIGNLSNFNAILPPDDGMANVGYYPFDPIVGDGYRQQAWLLGVSAPVGDNGHAMFSYQGGRIDNKQIDADFRFTTHVFSIGYQHSLSKRTSLYAMGSYGWTKGDYNDDGFGTYVRGRYTQAVIGLQHAF